jgi:hypothetical protein
MPRGVKRGRAAGVFERVWGATCMLVVGVL